MAWIALLAGCVGIIEGDPRVFGDAPEQVGAAPRAERPERVPRTRDPRGWFTPLHEREPPERVPGEVLFAPSDTPQAVAITLSESAVVSLRDEPDEEVEGTLAWRDHVYRAAVRLKGTSSFQSIDGKPSFKIDIHAYDPDQEIDGLERLTLNNMIEDPTMLREHAYYWTAARLGLPAPRQGYARVTVNGEDYGVYALVESMDEQLVARAFAEDPDGNLYESSGADFTYARDWFELEETGGVVPSPDDIEALVDAVEDARGGDVTELLTTHFDDRFLTFLALDIVAGNDDGYVFNHHNYLVYRGALSERWMPLPWGTDRAFSRDVPPRGDTTTPVLGHLAQACWADVTCAADLTDAIRDVLEVWEAELLPHLEAVAEPIAEACATDPRRDDRCQQDALLDYVRARPAFLAGYL